MKKVGKIIISLIVSLMLITNISYATVSADDQELTDAQKKAELDKIASRAEDIGKTIVKVVAGDISKVGQKGHRLTYGDLGQATFTIAAAFSNIALSIFKLSGAVEIVDDPIVALREHLDNRLDGIDQTLRNFNSNLDRMQNSINQSFATLSSEIDKISTTIDQNNITNVDLIYSKIKNEIDNFEPKMTSYITKWYKAKGYNEDLYVDYIADEQGKLNTIVIPKELITTAFNGAERCNPNKKEELITNIFKKVIELANNDPTTYADLLSGYAIYRDIVEGDEEEDKNKFAKAAYDSLRYNCMVDISLEDNYVATLIGDFSAYCNYLSEKDGKYVSPLRSRYNMFEKIFAFQGELNCRVENYSVDASGNPVPYDTNLANITMQEYFAQLSDIGAYVAEMAVASDCYSDDELNKLIYTPWASAEVMMNKTYNNFYHKTKSGTPIDNYCYITKSVIEYSNENLSADMYVKYENWYDYGNHKLTQHRIDVTKKELQKDLSFSVDNSVIVDNKEMIRLYAYYQAEQLRDTENTYDQTFGFYQYLKEKNVYKDNVVIDDLKNSFISPLIITAYVGSQNFGSTDSATMVGEMYAQGYLKKYPEKQSAGDYAGSNYKEVVTGSSPDFIIRKKAVADTFNALTGEINNNKNIGSVAMYFKDKQEDEIALLWDIDYIGTKYIINPDALNLRMDPTKAKNKLMAGIVENYIDEAKQFIAEPGYEYTSFPNDDVNYGRIYGRTDQSASWHSYKVHYKRYYGTILKNDVDIYATNEMISKTNTVEIKNEVKLANNYIQSLSFTDTNQELNSNFINATTEISNTRTNAKTKFVDALQTLGYQQADIEKLKLNDTYSISFNNNNCSNVDKETYNKMVEKMINYLNPSAGNVEEMANKYKTLIESISSVVDIANAENNQTGASLSREKIGELLVNYLKDLTGSENPGDFVVREEIPTSNIGKFVYCKGNGMLYQWDETTTTYITDSTPSKTKVLDEAKLGSSYRLVNSRDVIDVTSNPNGSTNYQGSLLKYNGSFYYWNEKIDKPRADHVGTYVEYTNITDSSTIPTVKTTDYIYCTSNNEYYEYQNGVNCHYVQVNPAVVTSLDVYKDDVVKYNGEFFQWNRDISPKAYEVVNESNGDPATLDEATYTYVSYNDNCYKWICLEGYVELDYDTLSVAPTDSTQYVKDYVKYGSDYYMWVVEKTKDTNPSHGKYIESVETVDEDLTEEEYTNLGSVEVPNQRVSDDAKGYIIKTNGKYYCWYSDLVESGKYKKISVDSGDPAGAKTTYYICDIDGKLYYWTSTISGKYVPVSKEKLEKIGLIVNTDKNLTTEENKKSYIGMYVKSTFDSKYYIWNENTDPISPSSVTGKYEEYTGATIVVLVDDALPTSGEEDITPSGNIEVYPKSTTTDIKLVYHVKPIISYELYFDKEIKTETDVDGANINYDVIPYFDIVPMITWNDAGTQKYLEISDEVLEDTDVGLIPIKIPVLDDDKIKNINTNDNRAIVYHFDNLEQTLVPSEELIATITTRNDAKYATVFSRSFSPFMIKKTYTIQNSQEYNVPNTGTYN